MVGPPWNKAAAPRPGAKGMAARVIPGVGSRQAVKARSLEPPKWGGWASAVTLDLEAWSHTEAGPKPEEYRMQVDRAWVQRRTQEVPSRSRFPCQRWTRPPTAADPISIEARTTAPPNSNVATTTPTSVARRSTKGEPPAGATGVRGATPTSWPVSLLAIRATTLRPCAWARPSHPASPPRNASCRAGRPQPRPVLPTTPARNRVKSSKVHRCW